jgi:arabinose-5-phosphate isomerase
MIFYSFIFITDKSIEQVMLYRTIFYKTNPPVDKYSVLRVQIYVILLWIRKYFLTFASMKEKNIQWMLEQEAEAVRNIPVDEAYKTAVELIIKHVHQQGGTLIISGMGKAGQIAMNIATTFSSTGTPACFLHPSEAQHGDLGIVRKHDLMLLISNSGKTRELIELIQLTRALVENIPCIVVTSDPESPLAREAAACLLTGAPTEVCPLGLTPTTSTTVMTVIGDLLVVSVMQRIGFTSADYAKRHHGGYLGSKSRQQSKHEK